MSKVSYFYVIVHRVALRSTMWTPECGHLVEAAVLSPETQWERDPEYIRLLMSQASEL